MKKQTIREYFAMVVEIVVWVWVLGILGYFYYTREYLSLISYLWGKIVG